MAKKNKFYQEPEEDEMFDEQSFLEEAEEPTEELVQLEVVAEEPVVVAEEAPKSESSKKNQNGTKAIVTSIRAFVFCDPDIFSRAIDAVMRGNQLNVIEVLDEEWLHVEVRKVNGPIEGFIQTKRVKLV